MPKRVIADDADGSIDPAEVIAGRRHAKVSSRFRPRPLPASVQAPSPAPSPLARVQFNSTRPAVEEKNGASGEASATKIFTFSQVVSPSSATNSLESEGKRRKSVSPAPATAKWPSTFSFPSMVPAPAPVTAPAPAERPPGFYFPRTAPAPAPAASTGFSFPSMVPAPAPVKESSIAGTEVKPTSTSLPVAANSRATGEVSAGNMNAFFKPTAPSSDFGSFSIGSERRSIAVPADSVPSTINRVSAALAPPALLQTSSLSTEISPTAVGFAVDVNRRTSNEASAASKSSLSLGDSPWTVSKFSTAENNRVNPSVPGSGAPSSTGFFSPPAALKRSEMKPLLEAPSPSSQPSAVHHTETKTNPTVASAANKNALSLRDSSWIVSKSSTAENNRVNASVPGGSVPSSTGFSSPPAALKRSEMKPMLEAPSPSSQPSVVHHTASSPIIESANVANNSTSVETNTLPSAPFGDGLTAIRGVRLNKRIMSWISHQVDTAPECRLDTGLLDYVVQSADIRIQVAFSKADMVSKVGTAFKHASPTAALTYPRSSPPKPTPALPVSSAAVAQATPLSIEAVPTLAPKLAVAPTDSATTGFHFSAPSTLPTPSGSSTLFSSRAPKDPSEKQAPAPAAVTTLPRAARGTLFPSKAPQAPSGEEAASPSVTSTLAPAPFGKLFSSKASAPALNPTPTPASSAMPGFFHTPSTLPPAPPGEKFSFKLPSAPAFTSTSAAPAVTALAKSSSSSSPSLGFKFEAGLPSSSFPSSFTGFKVPGGVAAPPLFAGGTAGGAAGGAADDEEAEMPKDDPAQLERAPGEENETVVRNFRAKLFIFKNDEKTWGDLGVGVLRLMEHKTDGTRRFILRNDMGKVLLNAGFYKGMKVTKMKNSISFMANMAEGGPKHVMLKVTANEIQDLHNTVLALLPTS